MSLQLKLFFLRSLSYWIKNIGDLNCSSFLEFLDLGNLRYEFVLCVSLVYPCVLAFHPFLFK
jgi:hypothetical protein